MEFASGSRTSGVSATMTIAQAIADPTKKPQAATMLSPDFFSEERRLRFERGLVDGRF